MPHAKELAASDSDLSNAGAPAEDEIEISDEMSEAGIRAYCHYDMRCGDDGHLVRTIYRKMEVTRIKQNKMGA